MKSILHRPRHSAPLYSLTPSPLGRVQPIPMDTEAVKRQGWRREHILVVNERDARLDFVEREFIRRIGERLYGNQLKSEGGQRHG
jgi:hypothetical protein